LLLKKAKCALTAWFKQGCDSNISVAGSWHYYQGEGLAHPSAQVSMVETAGKSWMCYQK